VLSGSHANPFGWVGRLGYYRQSDQDTYWLRARIYSQVVGRFLSRDPMPNGNLYLYPNNSPLVLVDPSGRQGCRAPGCRQGSPSGPATSGPRRYADGRYLRPSPSQPLEPPAAEEMEAEEEAPAGGGAAPDAQEGRSCSLLSPGGGRDNKVYGGGWR
jgi:RHS repeat-associated protein